MASLNRMTSEKIGMKMLKALVNLALALLLLTAGVAQVGENLLQEDIQDLLREFPAESSQKLDNLASSILRLGGDGILAICQTLAPPGQADDSQTRFALGGLTTYVCRQGNEDKRALFARTIIRALDVTEDKEVKAFLIRLLQRCGGSESVGPLMKYLKDGVLCEPAAQALQAMDSARAERALFRSLDIVAPQNRVTIVKALGEKKNKRAVKKILDYAASLDGNLRGAALFALANIGDSRAEDVLSRFNVAASPLERAQAPSLYLLYALRLGESGDRLGCVKICRQLIRAYTSPRETHIPCAALDVLVDVLGTEAFPDLLVAADSPHKAVRIKALSLVESFSGAETTASWISKMEISPPEIRAEIIDMLGRRGDRSALPYILKELESEEPVLLVAAVDASVLLGGRSVLDKLWPLLETDSGEVIEAVRRALLGFPAELVVAKAAGLIDSLPLLARMALVEILAERQAKDYAEVVFAQTESDDKELRLKAFTALEFLCRESDLPRLIGMLMKTAENQEILALQDAIVAAASQIENPERRIDPLLEFFDTAEVKSKLDLLRIFHRIAGKKGLQTLITQSQSVDARIQTVAVSTLSRWPNFEAAETLKNIITNTGNPTFRYVCLRGFVRLLGEVDLPPEEKFFQMEKILNAVSVVEDKKVLLSGMAGIKSKKSLDWVFTYLDDPELASDAARAVIRIALPEEGEELGLTGKDVEDALKRAVDVLESEDTENQVQEYLGVLWKREGFVSLFNGNDLSGWVGDTRGYVADEGKIVVFPERGSGNLYTKKLYSDFILRFEFKLTPGANNGLGIRTPLTGDPAYVAIELQILDNTADIYKDLKPYQYHGSLYGVVPAKRGFLRPVGEWNTQEVTARGRRITVKLNGQIILDVDIDQAIKEGTMDGRDHPGLMRETGHIGFLGHGSVVEFRSIWIKELR